jgi:putative nucleotidyltransferase with HDIG domain
MIPKKQQCLSLLDEKGVPEHIRRHIFQVTRIAMFLGRRISQKENINLPLLEAASLLHDLDKHLTFEDIHNHGRITAKKLKELGYDELIPLIINHAGPSVNPIRDLVTYEEKILYYADRRVNHDRIVPLPERIAYLKERYGSLSTEAMRKLRDVEPHLYALEKEILGKAGVSAALEGMK